MGDDTKAGIIATGVPTHDEAAALTMNLMKTLQKEFGALKVLEVGSTFALDLMVIAFTEPLETPTVTVDRRMLSHVLGVYLAAVGRAYGSALKEAKSPRGPTS